MKPCAPDTTMRQFGVSTTADLLEGASAAIQEAEQSSDEERVHKMRVAIRRFQQSLRLFQPFLRKKGVRRVRRELKSVMEPAGELRNHDIAIRLVGKAKKDSAELRERRSEASTVFVGALRKLIETDLAMRWKKLLELPKT